MTPDPDAALPFAILSFVYSVLLTVYKRYSLDPTDFISSFLSLGPRDYLDCLEYLELPDTLDLLFKLLSVYCSPKFILIFGDYFPAFIALIF